MSAKHSNRERMLVIREPDRAISYLIYLVIFLTFAALSAGMVCKGAQCSDLESGQSGPVTKN